MIDGQIGEHKRNLMHFRERLARSRDKDVLDHAEKGIASSRENLSELRAIRTFVKEKLNG